MVSSARCPGVDGGGAQGLGGVIRHVRVIGRGAGGRGEEGQLSSVISQPGDRGTCSRLLAKALLSPICYQFLQII